MKVNQALCGDAIEIMDIFDTNSIDSLVGDGPYGIGFLGHKWDKFTSKEYQDFCFEWGSKAIRILKPGAYCLSFSAPKKYHRMVCGLEDAGFLIKDMIPYMYGTGIPKNLDISKAIDRYFGKENEREVIGIRYRHGGGTEEEYMGMTADPKVKITKPVSKEAKQWDGWGTGLSPGHEDIVLAQKPYEGTYAENILLWNCGGLNIDACRLDYIKEKETDSRIYNQEKNITRGTHENATIKYAPDGNEFPMYKTQKGRWPSNVILDSISAELLDKQSGISKGGTPRHNSEIHRKGFSGNGPFNELSCGFNVNKCTGLANFGDKGGASRFFYCAKAYVKERNAGCENLYWEKINGDLKKIAKKQYNLLPPKKRVKGNPVSTLKPINLMRYLVRLVTPPGGTVLDPFGGSGTTGIACIIEGFNYILIEKRSQFAEIIIPKRLKWWSDPSHWKLLKDHPLLPEIKQKQNKVLDTWI